MKHLHVLTVLVENNAGVLTRIAGLFARRAYNIDSLSVGETEDPKKSRMTIATHADDATLEQITHQLAKLTEVLEITELNKENAALREHVLVKVASKDRSAVMEVCDIFRARIVDISRTTLTAELTGGPSKINAFVDQMEQYDIKDLVRTGLTGLPRG